MASKSVIKSVIKVLCFKKTLKRLIKKHVEFIYID